MQNCEKKVQIARQSRNFLYFFSVVETGFRKSQLGEIRETEINWVY